MAFSNLRQIQITYIKTKVIEKLTKGNYLSDITNMSKKRVTSNILTDVNRQTIIIDILIRVSNAKVGNTIRNYCSNNLTRVNIVKFRTYLGVLSI